MFTFVNACVQMRGKGVSSFPIFSLVPAHPVFEINTLLPAAKLQYVPHSTMLLWTTRPKQALAKQPSQMLVEGCCNYSPQFRSKMANCWVHSSKYDLYRARTHTWIISFRCQSMHAILAYRMHTILGISHSIGKWHDAFLKKGKATSTFLWLLASNMQLFQQSKCATRIESSRLVAHRTEMYRCQ